MGPFLVGLVKRCVLAIDWFLRRAHQIRPVSQDPVCLLRFSLTRARHELQLSDGCTIHKGDRLAALHLWNERVSKLGSGGLSLGWAKEFVSQFRASLGLLVPLLLRDARLQSATAVYGELSFLTDMAQAHRFFKAFGFDLVLLDDPGLRVWRRAFWDNLFAYGLVMAFSPASLADKRLQELKRAQIWMSRERLLRGHAGLVQGWKKGHSAAPLMSGAGQRNTFDMRYLASTDKR